MCGCVSVREAGNLPGAKVMTVMSHMLGTELWKNSKCLTIEPSFQPESPDLRQREGNEKSHFFVNRILKENRTAVVGGIYVVLRTSWDGFRNASSLSGSQVLDPISTIKQA